VPIHDVEHDLWLRSVAFELPLRLLPIPRPLCFVEYDDPIGRWDRRCEVRIDESVHVLNKRRDPPARLGDRLPGAFRVVAGQCLREDLYKRAVTREEYA
jgi:hypothetical protein